MVFQLGELPFRGFQNFPRCLAHFLKRMLNVSGQKSDEKVQHSYNPET